jgi:ribosome recycling factor
VSLRQLRNDQREEWKKEKEAGEISEDEFFRREKLLQELVDKSNNEIDIFVKQKEEDLRQI